MLMDMLDDDSLRSIVSMSNVSSAIMLMRTCKRMRSLIDAKPASIFGSDVRDTTFTWDIPEEMLDTCKIRSSKFTSGVWPLPEYDWTLLAFPLGNRSDHLSMYLEIPHITRKRKSLCRAVRIFFRVHPPTDNSLDTRRETTHTFYKSHICDWGFRDICPLDEIDTFMNQGRLRVSVRVSVDL